MTEPAGPIIPCVVRVSGGAEGAPALRVAGYTALPAGRAVEGGPARPVRVITADEVAAGYPVQGNTPVPMLLVSDGHPVLGQPAIPVYVVAGSFGPDPPPGGNVRVTVDGDVRVTTTGDTRVTT